MTYLPSVNSYALYIASNITGQAVRSIRPVKYGDVYTNIIFVMEHQVSACNQLPPTGQIVFENIQVAYENVAVPAPAWTAQPFQPVCSSNAKILSPSAVALTWDPNGTVEAAAAPEETAAAAAATPRHRKWASAFRRARSQQA